jgi:hypothetical protein
MKPNPKLASHLDSKLNFAWMMVFLLCKETMEHESLFGRSKKVLQFYNLIDNEPFSLLTCMFCGRLRIFDSKAPFSEVHSRPQNHPNSPLSYHSNWTDDLKTVSSQTSIRHSFNQS